MINGKKRMKERKRETETETGRKCIALQQNKINFFSHADSAHEYYSNKEYA
jgi:hypothetical protein